jgi:hypothetical protein
MPTDHAIIYALGTAFIILGILVVLGQLGLIWCFVKLTRLIESIVRMAPVAPDRPSTHDYVVPSRPWPRVEPKKVLVERESGDHRCSCGGKADIVTSAAHETSTVLKLRCRACEKEFETVLNP